VISKLLVITDGGRFCNSKETENNKYIIHIGSYLSLGSTVQPKLFVISRILAAKCHSAVHYVTIKFTSCSHSNRRPLQP